MIRGAVYSDISGTGTSNWKAIASHLLLSTLEGHKPWLTTYKVPSHASTLVRAGRCSTPVFPHSPSAFSSEVAHERKW